MIRDRRTIICEFKNDPDATRKLGEALVASSADGYTIINAQTRSRGQRDPIVEGLEVTLGRDVE